MITTREQFATEYFRRCITVDGFIVMKSATEFKMHQIFGGAFSRILGQVNVKMVVVGTSNAAEAKDQAKRLGNVDIKAVDLRSKYYYRIAPEKRWNPYFSLVN